MENRKGSTMEYGKVWLAGAGPSDEELLTVKTKKLLEKADVIVYDALVGVEILSQIPEDKELIYVGKRANHHPVPQAEIQEILVREAKKGKQVLRLKGGDPFVFGRGGEEVERLLEEGIPFEIVPGVTSAVAVPAYAGIPITHRDYTSSFHVITGHAKAGEEVQIAYEQLVRLNGTLVFLMGIKALPSICAGLLKAGMNPNMPAAVLERGTTCFQRRVVSTVENLPKDARKADIQTPAIIVVGRVAALSETMHWAQKRPLGNTRILVTRPRQNSGKLIEQLHTLGAQVVELPSITVSPIEENEEFIRAMDQFGTRAKEEWIVFTSPIGVEIFFKQLQKYKRDIRSLFGVKIAAIGVGTANALKQYGLCVDLVPEVYCAKALGEAIAKAASKGAAVTVVRALDGSKELLPPMLDAGILVEDIPIYETKYLLHENLKEQISRLFEQSEISAVTFTSASTVKGFVQMLEGMDFSKVKAVCIGEQTAQEARAYQMQIEVCKQATIESMIEKLLEMFA